MSTGEISPQKISRRALLERAVYLVGGAAAYSQLLGCSGSQTVLRPSADATRIPATSGFFTDDQLARLDAIADIIIPETDTPGARAARVPEFIDSMMTNWASEETRADYVAVLEQIDVRAITEFGAGFLELAPELGLETVRMHDEEAFAAEDEAYTNFKELVLLGYYHSEVGATRELRYEHVPGQWRACIPLSAARRTWAF